MKIFFILMFFFIIIAPFLYFLYIFKHLKYSHKIIIFFITLLSLIVISIKIFFHPYQPFFFILTLIIQFYMLTVFITMIFFAIYQGIMYIFHKLPKRKMLIIFGLIGMITTSFGYVTHYDKTKASYDIVIHKESTLSSLKIAAVSDMHIGTGTYLQDIQNFVKKINQAQYDFVCLIGDLFDETTPIEMVDEIMLSLSKMKTTYGIYAVNGNHEHYANITDESIYKKHNIQFLDENYVCVDGLVNIVGREDVVAHDSLPINELTKGMDPTLPTIVLDHNPKRYQDIMDIADLQLSGHTHAGQIFPMTLLTAPLYDDVYGLLQKNDFSLVVTSGYGSWGFPMRLLTHCEYLDIKITFSKK